MATRRQHIKLGIFLLAVALLVALTLAFVGGQRLWQERNPYYVISNESISGIDVDSPVTLRGVKVGEVSGVELDRNDFGRVMIELAVEPDVAIPAQARAYFRRVGLTGQRAIDITGGTTAEGTLPSGSIIPRGSTTLEGLEDRADAFAERAVALLEQTTALVEQLQRAASTVDGERVDRLLADVEAFVSTMNEVGDELQRTVVVTRRGVGKVVGNVDDVAGQATAWIHDVQGATAEVRNLVRHADLVLRVNEDDVRAMLGHLRRTTRNTEQLSRQLRLRPSLLLRSDPPKERELP